MNSLLRDLSLDNTGNRLVAEASQRLGASQSSLPSPTGVVAHKVHRPPPHLQLGHREQQKAEEKSIHRERKNVRINIRSESLVRSMDLIFDPAYHITQH